MNRTQQRLIDAMEKRGIHVYRYPNNRTMYELLDMFGLMQCVSVIKDVERNLILPDDDLNIYIAPKGKGSKHRVFVQCECQQFVPYGRLHQHKCK